ncbi:alpha/beta hydrolase [Gimesia aquarii]|uniref:Acetyl esterase n=1 Tax=Gimesia aquarii TaxID=2527964 RepID=A0A517VP05_9PLAN|nr:alpha/beta hydrolase [Gimesia aquarii]QDT94640.1 acetyl esterase [Gimesia aquarii]
MVRFFLYFFLFCVPGFGISQAFGNEDLKANTKSAQVKTISMVYKKEPRRSLTVYYPDGWKPTDKRSALVIFRCRIPEQREYFRQRGMVIIKPQLAGVNSGKLPGLSLNEIAKLPKPRLQVEDTKSVIRFVRKNASQLGVNPQRIVATGTSGGGDLALQSYLNSAFEDPNDDRSVSHRPNALVLYCPAFDGIDIWYVKMETLLNNTKAKAPSFTPHLLQFIKNTTDDYATPLDHRAKLIELAAKLGKEQKIDESEIKHFQEILKLFNQRDWQLLHPVEDALKMSASRILTKEPLPPTLIMFGDRDHLFQHQKAFVEKAKAQGQNFELKIFKGAGHSFMLQPAFMEPSTNEVESFLKNQGFLP